MSEIDTSYGPEAFRDSLSHNARKMAKRLKVEVPPFASPGDIFSTLIEDCYNKYGCQAAVLIDEYDAPVTNLLDKPDEAEQAREMLRAFYGRLKANDKFLSFVFVTGITKYVKGGLYSAFNNPKDISYDPEYGALTGFTHEEIQQYYGTYVKHAADCRKVPEEKLLEGMKQYYNGFCFDAKTLVYNPFSTLRFFERKKFFNFWFHSGSPKQLITFLNANELKLEDFQKISIPQDMVENPVDDKDNFPATFLFQLGYLSLRPSPVPDFFLLDYPNTEVRNSMASYLLMSYFKNSKTVVDACANLKAALMNRDPAAFIEQINKVLSEYPYDYYQTDKRDEYFYCLGLFTFFYASGLSVQAEKHGIFGRADFILKDEELTWVVEIKVSHGNADDTKLAAAALEQIKEKNYAGASQNPVLLGAVINDGARVIKSWECRGGIEEKPVDPLAQKGPTKPKGSLAPDSEVEDEVEYSGPRPH
jgi:hypothetical protein